MLSPVVRSVGNNVDGVPITPGVMVGVIADWADAGDSRICEVNGDGEGIRGESAALPNAEWNESPLNDRDNGLGMGGGAIEGFLSSITSISVKLNDLTRNTSFAAFSAVSFARCQFKSAVNRSWVRISRWQRTLVSSKRRRLMRFEAFRTTI